ncbi:MAG: hypothetical protein LBV04_10460 [Deferribacteraceae bacterium]|jgi:hypothetical protein|nr:hypothetical protein [Deferribacteraceae bacterium]
MTINTFSWQKNDWELLLNETNKITIITGSDFESPYNIFHLFQQHGLKDDNKLFIIEKANYILPPLHPFSSVLSRVSDKSLVSSIIKDFTRSETLSTIVSNFLFSFTKKDLLLDEQSNDIMIQFQKIIGQQKSIFVFKNYSSFDDLSMQLAHLMISGKLDITYEFLSYARFYFLRSENENFDIYNEIEDYAHRNILLSKPTINNSKEIVLEIAPELNLSEKDRCELFTVCGGSMIALDILLRYLKSEKIGSLSITTIYDTIIAILKMRLDSIGLDSLPLERTLKIAAAIGDTFSLHLLRYIADLPETIFKKVMLKSQNEMLIKYDDTSGRFTYSIIKMFFQEILDPYEKISIYKSIANGIYHFNPHDYWTRATFLELSENIEDACEIYFLAFHIS